MAHSNLLDDFANLRLNETKDINILLLGETGVGKSTFINSIANYLTHKSLKKALKDDLFVLIPSKITLTDKHRHPMTISIGKFADQNEYQETGVSATQDVKTYVFPIGENGKTKLRLIDTPGMADCRGIKQDDKNCENILNYLTQLHELHAICFLLKSGIARITVAFEYCIKQIFSRLDKSASKNLIFIFTNTRGTNYDAGETLPCLEKVINNIKKQPPHVEIPLKENIFYFDNEGFRYLAGAKQGVEFDEEFKDDCKKSWKKSTRECWRLISYIVGDSNRRPLKPHQLSNTISINEARKLIIHLSQPLAEITQLINDKLYALEKHRYQLRMQNQSLDELKSKLYLPVVNLEITKLTQPATVCAAKKCAEVYQVGELNKWHYKQRCHDPCYLRDVTAEMIGDPGLRHCTAMNGSETCQKCGCIFSVHMHIYYMSKTVNDKIIDNVIQKNIRTKQSAVAEAERLIQEIDQMRKELEDERESVITATAKFAHFLQNNAITPFNDSYKAYIQHLIARERSLGSSADAFSIYKLEKLLEQYEESKHVFERNLKQGNKSLDSIDTKNILETIKNLYTLKHTGSKIREMLDKQKTSRRKEFEKTEYLHKSSAKPPINKDDKNQKKDKKETDTKQKQSQKDNKNHTPPPPYTPFPPRNHQFKRNNFNQNRNFGRPSGQFNPQSSQPGPAIGVRVEVSQNPNQDSFAGNFGQPNYQPLANFQQNYPPPLLPQYQQIPQQSGPYQMPQQQYPVYQQLPPSYQQNQQFPPPYQQNRQFPDYGNTVQQQNYRQQPQQNHQQQQKYKRGGKSKQGGFKRRSRSGAKYNKNKQNQTSTDNYDSSDSDSSSSSSSSSD